MYFVTNLLRLFAPILLFTLSACGGGGGSSGGGTTTLFISVTYPWSGIDIYTSSTVSPTLSGFQGYTPVCTLLSGSVPTGMTLNSDCSISGIPTAAGTFGFNVRVGASGAIGTVDANGSITTYGPSLNYPNHSAYHIGDTANDTPTIGWNAPSGMTVQYAYQITSGTLPTGLTLNSTTGVISGTVSTQDAGSNTYIRLTITTPHGNATADGFYYFISTGLPTFVYDNTNGADAGKAYISQSFSSNPMPNGGTGVLSAFSISGAALPAGLSLNTSTGTISGTPNTSSATQTYNLTATITNSAITSATTGSISLNVLVPYYISYNPPNGHVGSLQTISPSIVQVSSIPPAGGATYSYVTRAPGITGCTLPPSMTLNTSTGEVTGTPTTAGSYGCIVDITYTNNFVSWVGASPIYIVIN